MRIDVWTVRFLVFVVFAGMYKSFAAEPFHYEPETVQLSGNVAVEEHYGPPNFGETPAIDKKEGVIILNLDAPIDVTPGSQSSANVSSFNDVQHIQLLGQQTLQLMHLGGRHIILRGRLFEKQSGENFTDVLMNVGEIVSK
jgi:hypothetical protein